MNLSMEWILVIRTSHCDCNTPILFCFIVHTFVICGLEVCECGQVQRNKSCALCQQDFLALLNPFYSTTSSLLAQLITTRTTYYHL